MHGTILCGFRQYVREAYDEDTWEAVHERADVGGQLLVPVTEYPDPYYYELVGAAAEVTDRDPTALQRDFGRALVDQYLADDVQHPADDAWQFADDVVEVCDHGATLEQLASADEWVGQAFGLDGDGSSPLAFTAARRGERRVGLTYSSPLGLCTVVESIVVELVAAMGADCSVEEVNCMHDGGTECEFVVEAPRSKPVAAPAVGQRSTETTD